MNKNEMKRKIESILNNNLDFAMVDGEITMCEFTKCEECDFNISYNEDHSCTAMAMKFLIDLYKEESKEECEKSEPKISLKEKQFLRLVETGYIERNHNGLLNYYYLNEKNGLMKTKLVNLSFLKFDFIETDSVAWKVEDLLKLEIKLY